VSGGVLPARLKTLAVLYFVFGAAWIGALGKPRVCTPAVGAFFLDRPDPAFEEGLPLIMLPLIT